MSEQTDIVQEILADREKGTARLVAEYRERLYTAAFALCRDVHEAEDLVFCTIERVLAKIASYKERESFYEWMHVILLNIYRNSVRGKVVRNTIPVGGMQEMDFLAEPQSNDSIAAAVDNDTVRQFLEKMPDNMREVLLLHYFMDMPVTQIAKFLALPVGTIKSRLHYARMALAHRFGVNFKRVAMVFAVSLLLLAASATAIFGSLDGESDGTTAATDIALEDQSGISVQEVAFVPDAPEFSYFTSLSIQQGETAMTRKKAAAAALSAAMAAVPLAVARGDGYQFIDPTTYPAANARHSAKSSTVAIEAGAMRVAGTADDLEARSRARSASSAIALNASKMKVFSISIK